jgi:hypothetical protein
VTRLASIEERVGWPLPAAQKGGTPVATMSRSNLPIPHRAHVGLITYDAKELFIDGTASGGSRIGETAPRNSSTDETLDVGLGTGTDSQDHLISAEERMRVATAIQ